MHDLGFFRSQVVKIPSIVYVTDTQFAKRLLVMETLS